jgi:hypothetical protein
VTHSISAKSRLEMSSDQCAGQRRHHLRGVAIVAILLVAATALITPTNAGADGFSSKSAAQIFKAGIKASSATSSFSVSGTINQPKTDLTLNLSLSASGMSQGSLVINGEHVQIRVIGGTGYFNGDTAFWTKNGSAAAAQVFAGKWIYAPIANSLFSGLRAFFSPRSFIHSFLGTTKGPFSKSGTASFGGKPAVGVSANGPGTMYVETSGGHFIVKVQASTAGSSGALTFSSYGVPVHPTKPPGAVSLQSLQNQG